MLLLPDMNLRVAIMHDWLPVYGGAERVLEQIINVFPESDLFSMVDFIPEGQRDFLQNKPVCTSFIQKLPFARKKYRAYLPIMPLAVEQFDFSAYDLILSSSYAVAKGVITGPDQLHICYCHSPIRYAWDLQNQYLAAAGIKKGLKSWLTRSILHYIRSWDAQSATRVDSFMANSEFVARRIEKTYRREAAVIHPPVDIAAFTLQAEKEGYYLTASRMVPYKRIDLIVEAFSGMPERELRVIGEGPDFEKIKSKAGSNVKMLGYQNFEALKEQMQKARAFVFAAEEDFGIAPVEAQACGTPVIAFGKGGVTETVIEGETGVFYNEQTVESLQAGVREFEAAADDFDPIVIRRNAMRFSAERFQQEFALEVARAWEVFMRRNAPRPTVQHISFESPVFDEVAATLPRIVRAA
jgi:glycosyltransferase involved in cell wall biosynthesis